MFCENLLVTGQKSEILTISKYNLLTGYINIFKKLEIRSVTEGEQKEPEVNIKNKKRHYGGKMSRND